MATNKQLIAESIQFLCLQGETELAEKVTQAYCNDELLTFAEWKKKGYSVRKGEKSMFSCSLWKKLSKAEKEKAKKKLEEKAKLEGKEKAQKPSSFVMTKCSFFLPSQVEKIQKEIAV